MQTNTLRGKKQLLIGFTLFSMFFGAGNLIFPPYLGAQAGTRLWLAFAGFAVSAIGLPIAGVVAVARGRGAAPAGRAGAPPVCAGLLHSGISLHWAMPRHPPHGQHLVCDAGAAGRGKHRAAVGLLPPVFCSGLSGGPAPGEADPAAGQNPLPRLAGPDPAAVCGLSAPPGSSRLRHPDRRLHRPARRAGHPGRLPGPWTLWPG